jgi:hypothetical protein
MLKFISNPFRAGRALEGTIDELVDKMREFASQPQSDPNAAQQQADAKAREQEAAEKSQERQETMAMRREEHGFKMDEMRATAVQRAAEFERKRQIDSDSQVN